MAWPKQLGQQFHDLFQPNDFDKHLRTHKDTHIHIDTHTHTHRHSHTLTLTLPELGRCLRSANQQQSDLAFRRTCHGS